jgi:hypothetical protein
METQRPKLSNAGDSLGIGEKNLTKPGNHLQTASKKTRGAFSVPFPDARVPLRPTDKGWSRLDWKGLKT